VESFVTWRYLKLGFFFFFIRTTLRLPSQMSQMTTITQVRCIYRNMLQFGEGGGGGGGGGRRRRRDDVVWLSVLMLQLAC
jgi:hypothetical protein